MYANATTTISILRGDDVEDRWGDATPSDTPAYSNVPASIINQQKVVVTPDTMEPNIVTTTTCRVGSGTDIQYGDRIKDNTTGTVYSILNSRLNENPYNTPDIVMMLKRISNYGA